MSRALHRKILEIPHAVMIKPIKVTPTSALSKVFGQLLKHPSKRIVFVVENNQLVGMITRLELLKFLVSKAEEMPVTPHAEFGVASQMLHYLSASKAKDLMLPPVAVKTSDTLVTVMCLMIEKGIYEVAVVDEDGRFVGSVNDVKLFVYAFKA